MRGWGEGTQYQWFQLNPNSGYLTWVRVEKFCAEPAKKARLGPRFILLGGLLDCCRREGRISFDPHGEGFAAPDDEAPSPHPVLGLTEATRSRQLSRSRYYSKR